MKILFSLLSLFYIAAIFILAGSPMVKTLSEFNPNSLLHIPLYGILAFLLVLSIVPISRRPKDLSIQQSNDSTRPTSKKRAGLIPRLFMVGWVALAVGIFDEVHQLYVPGRDASVTDVVLDMVGIALGLVLFFGLVKTRVLNLKN
jgi:hypothetical protein